LQDKLQQTLSDQDKIRQADLNACTARVDEAEQLHEDEQAAIASLRKELNEKENILQDKVQQSLSDQGKLHQADIDTWRSIVTEVEQARKIDQETIASLEDILDQKESLLQEKLQQALIEKDQLHKSDVGTWKSKLLELEESNDALHRELSELSVQTSIPEDHTECTQERSSLKMDLQNVLNDSEEKRIQHNLELATVNAEFHNAMNSLDESQKENQKLKLDIESLSSMKSSKETDENRNFEKEMNAAHTRFESMEKALQDRVTRLMREKDKLVADFNDEMINKEEEHTKTKIELSAWKLEMQNALNDIESLKKERDELTAQIQSYNNM